MHTIQLTDEQYGRLEHAAGKFNVTPDKLIGNLIAVLPAPRPPLVQEEREREITSLLTFIEEINRDALNTPRLTVEEIEAAIAAEGGRIDDVS